MYVCEHLTSSPLHSLHSTGHASKSVQPESIRVEETSAKNQSLSGQDRICKCCDPLKLEAKQITHQITGTHKFHAARTQL